MISEIIQQQLTSYGFESYSILYNDQKDQLPLHEMVIHSHELTAVHEDREGIYGCEYLVTINIYGVDPDVIESLRPKVTRAILNISDPRVLDKTLKSWEPIDFEEPIERYFSAGEFILETTNNISHDTETNISENDHYQV
ncbi:hypothetical protein K4L44_05840 [Halosquirtibacter laminarini]|uniref:Uncharacterized protein n=1 Tax=Halosquirtibacter laminarini TaxID=3374600 RepID=A0AC61NII0_9BACT|nr:hypothetical protein K4L44_05840 [Prolixibacteraceae bacterium]